MSEISQPGVPLQARVQRRRRVSMIWAIPLVTVVIAAWLVWHTYSQRGPVITIIFDGAEGLQAGQSHVKHKDLDVGVVQSIVMTEDLQRVMVTVQMTPKAERLLTDRTQFWVVRPRLSGATISGLSTLLSGSYIALLPGVEKGKPERHFTGLEDPPVLQANIPGRTFLLKANRLGSINPGSPIFFRDLTVGEVLGWDLGDMAETVTIHAFVRAPFDQYVHDDSQFWNASGISFKLGPDGAKLELESLQALLLGGVAFKTPAVGRKSVASAADRIFTLYPDQDAVNQAGFSRRVPGLAYFQGSVSGLGPGSPVTFQGLRIGEVVSIDLAYDPKSDTIRAPVRFEIEPQRIADVHVMAERGPVDNARLLVERGLRAQLQSANLITGQMQVALAFFPDAAPAEMQVEDGVIVLPTVPGQFAGLADSVTDLLTRVKQMPFRQIGDNLNDTLRSLNEIASGQELKRSLAALQSTLAGTQELVSRADAGLGPTLKQLPAVTATLEATLTQANKLLLSTDVGYGDNSKFNRDLERLMAQLNDMVRSFRTLADLLTRHPEALIRGRTDTGVQ